MNDQPQPDCYARINVPMQPQPWRVRVLSQPNPWGEVFVEAVSGPRDGERRWVDNARLYDLELRATEDTTQ